MRGVRFFIFGVFAAAFALLPVAAVAATPTPAVVAASPSPSPSPQVSISPMSLTFANGDTTPKTLTILNSGNATLDFFPGTPFTITAGFANDNSTCGSSLAPNDKCTVDVTATSGGPLTGTLTITTLSPSKQFKVALNISPPPTPRGSTFLNPSSAPPSSKVTFSGSGLDAGATLHVLFDGNPVTDVNTDGSGNFSIQLAIPDDATGTSHQVCVSEANGQVCASFTLEPKPATPTPTDTPSPSPSTSTSPSPSAGPVAVLQSPGGGTTLLGFLARPPFVFLPIVAALGLLAFLGLYLRRVRPAAPIGEVTILHRAPPPRLYGELDPSPAPSAPPAPPPAPAAPIVYESASGPSTAPPALRPPAPPSGTDVPPEMPEASD